MKLLPYNVWQYIASFVDDIEVRRDFEVYNQIKIPSKIKNIYYVLPGMSPNGTIRCILPNRLKSRERIENQIDDDTLDIRIQVFDDCVEYHYKYYIFGKSPENMRNNHAGLNIVLEIYCWYYSEFIYIRY